jgi:hypothetical protein
MRYSIAIALIILFTSVTNANASTTYLECVSSSLEGEFQMLFTISLSESTGNITHTEPNRSPLPRPDVAFNTKGFFSPTKVIYQYSKHGAGIINAVSIDRNTLKYESSLGTGPVSVPAHSGECKVLKTPKRKF